MNYNSSEEFIESINSDDWNDYIENVEVIKNTVISGNNVLHMACLRGKEYIIENIIQKNPELFYLSNEQGDNCAHILLKNGWYSILKKYVLKFLDILTFINKDGNTIFQISIDKPKLLRWLLDQLLDTQIYILNNINNEGKTLLILLIDHYITHKNNRETIEYIIDKVDLNLPKNNPVLIYTVNIGSIEIIYLLLKNGADVNIRDIRGTTSLIISIKNDTFNITELLMQYGADINIQDYELKNLPLNMAILKKNKNLLELMLQYSINLDIKNKYMNTPMHYLIFTNKKNQWVSNDILEKMIQKSNMLEKNIKNTSAFDILKKTGLWTNMNELQKNKILNIIKKKKSKMARSIIGEIILPKTIEVNYGQFNPDMLHNIFYTLIFLKKYSNIMIPYQWKIDDKGQFDKTNLHELNLFKTDMGETVFKILELYTEYFNEIAPYILIWHNKNINYINPDLNIYILKLLENGGIRFILLKLTIVTGSNASHANIIIYDKLLNEAYRFEPYGIIDLYDNNLLNRTIEMELNKYTNKKIKYYSPEDYMDSVPIQINSNELDQEKKKLGDPFGYCLSFCFWFIELKLLNPNINIKELMKGSLGLIIKKKSNTNPILDYIRNYSYRLTKKSNKFLIGAGINKGDIYKIIFNERETKKILKFCRNELNDIIEKRLIN